VRRLSARFGDDWDVVDCSSSDYATQCLLSFLCASGHPSWWYPQLWYVKKAVSPVRGLFSIVRLSLGRAIPRGNVIGSKIGKVSWPVRNPFFDVSLSLGLYVL
jgi:hypothetical protein